ncbi:hypothetical protein RJ640_020643, partial [Escallonia rubra]
YHCAPWLWIQTSKELMDEITAIEVEINHLERYLLSLYRTAFEQLLPTKLEYHGTHFENVIGTQMQNIADQSCYKLKRGMFKDSGDLHGPADSLAGSYVQSHATTPKLSSRKVLDEGFMPVVTRNVYHDQMQETKTANPGHRSLADHLGTSDIDNALNRPDRLSENIVRCIASIYCRLANPTPSQAGFSVSSTSSLSSSSTFSPKNISDGWSPHSNEEATAHCQYQGLKEERGPYATMIEVLKICLDDDSFNYAARMLQIFRSLVKSLEKVDPRKMKREEKLAFWINIHNALVMHAYLAYGAHNYVKGTPILKAAYNVGGQCINAYVIQSSILGIRSHYPAPWLQALLSPGKKRKTGSSRHVYAIEYPEPLLRFALCFGAFSDPAVRVYTAKDVFQELKLAKEEFVQANVYIHKEMKIYLPKILDDYAKDMSLTMPGLLEMVDMCLSDVQQKAMRRCVKGRADKYICWLPESSTFRYVIHRDAADGRQSD